MQGFNKISIKDVPGIHVGQVEDVDAGTGLTIIIADNKDGMAAGISVKGGGPASRDSELLNPKSAASGINALVFGGGSAFGLDATGGVLKYLEEKGIGYDVGVTKVPLVCQSDIFDLTVGDPFIRPDYNMGYKACVAAFNDNYKDGCYGAGCGATIGKMLGMDFCMKSGIGSYVLKKDDLIIGAIVVVNAFGDIYDYHTGKIMAGLLNEDKRTFKDTSKLMYESYKPIDNKFTDNTTIGAVFTNASFNKAELTKIADMAHNGYARSIKPVHTSADGDTIYALSIGDIKADIDIIGTLASDVIAEAIQVAIKSAASAYGYPALCDL